MNRNFARALSLVLKHEGGFVDHPADPGGATNKGITIGTYRAYINRNGTVADLKAITDAQVATVYRKQYWDKVRGDDLPDGVDYAVFDFAVNSGPARAAKYLQAVVGVAQDGAIGPVTLNAVRAANARQVIDKLCADRLAFLKRLKHWPTFKNGWTARVSHVETVALEMAAGAPVQPAKPAPAPSPAPKPVSPPTATPEPRGSAWGIAIFIAIAGAAALAAKHLGIF